MQNADNRLMINMTLFYYILVFHEFLKNLDDT